MANVELKYIRSTWIHFYCILLFISSASLAQNNSFIYHSPPEEARVGKDLEFISRVDDPGSIQLGTLYYRSAGGHSYREIMLDRRGFEFIGIIPGENLTASGLEYLIVLQNYSGGIIAFPTTDPFENPQFLPVQEDPDLSTRQQISFGGPKIDAVDADILILHPNNGEILFTDEVVIAASYFFMENIDSASIKILFDNVDVTSNSEVGDGVINYIAKDPAPGLHTINLMMSTNLGVPIRPFSWSFTIGESRFNVKDFVEYNGSINSQVSSESVGGTGLSVAEVSGKFNTNFKWLSLRSRFRMTTRESATLQPYNRLSTDLYLGDYLTVQIGDVNPNLSSFLINGQRIRGLGVTLSFKFLEFKMIRGEVKRSIQSLGILDRGYFLLNNTSIDSSGNVSYELDRRGYTFSRNLDAYRISFKWKQKYWFGLQFLKGKDDTNSLDKILGENNTFTVPDDSLIAGIPGGIYTYNKFQTAVEGINGTVKFQDNEWGGNDPVDNFVGGFHFGTSLDERRLKFEFNWNFSLYNRNIWNGAMTLSEMDTALDDTLDGNIGTQYESDGSIVEGSTLASLDAIPDPSNYQSIFTINAFMTPLVPIDVISFGDKPFTTVVNMPSSAFNLKLTGHYYSNNFSIEFRQVGPEYVTLGNPYLAKNIREFVATDRVSLLDRKLSITTSYTHRDNKILKNPSNPLVTNTFNLGISLLPGPNTPSFTFNIQSIGKDNEKEEKFENIGGIKVDKREEYRTVNSLISVNFPFEIGSIKNNLVVNFNEIKNVDLLVDDRVSSYTFSKMDLKSFSGSLNIQPFRSLRLIGNYSRSETAILLFVENIAIKVPLAWVSYGISGQYAILNNKIRLLAGLNSLKSEGLLDNSIYGLRGGAEYSIIDGLAASLSGNMQINRQKKDFDLTNSGLILSLRYRF